MRTVPLRFVADVWTSSVDKHTHEGELPVTLCNYTDVYRGDRLRPTDHLMRATATPDEIARFRLHVGDTVITKDSEDPNDIGISAYIEDTAEDFVCGYHLAIARPRGAVHPRFLTWALRGRLALGHFAVHSAGISRYGLSQQGLRSTPVWLPGVHVQRKIADFLDDRVARIDCIITARQQQGIALERSASARSHAMVRGMSAVGPRRGSGLAWLGSIPAEWAVHTTGSEFAVELGKMLDEKRQTGTAALPYLRNINVQWDRVDTDDLKSMDIPLGERDRFTVRRGDLLICEGGQPGRAAVWAGGIEPLGYQKALHRARSRGRSREAWLLECLRVAVDMNAFAVENGQTTIGHLTNEQIRSQRFPFPDRETQDALLADLARDRGEIARAREALDRSTELLAEYKQSLVTAAVTGELDVTTAGSGVPG